MIIKEMSLELRPRERLKANGVGVLSDSELLAVVLRMGSKDENVVSMSNRIISRYGLDKLSSCSLTELQEIKGIGEAKAMQIHALFELSKRVKTNNSNKIIKSPKDIFDYLSPKMSNLDKEHFVVLLLDTKNKIIKEETVSIGTLNMSIVHPREIFKTAIKESANSLILVHNHPSGDPTPSQDDEDITNRLVEAGGTLDIKVLDHVIIGDDKFWSWKEC